MKTRAVACVNSNTKVREFEHEEGGGFSGRGPKGYRRSDERIREDVCDRLADDPRIDASDVEVTVNQGEVILSGTIHSRQEKRTSEDLIETISGVRDIQNNLRVSRWQGPQDTGAGNPHDLRRKYRRNASREALEAVAACGIHRLGSS
jgi:osmotically-inducible protein OsmY